MLSRKLLLSLGLATTLSMPAYASGFSLNIVGNITPQHTTTLISSEDKRDQKALDFIKDLAKQGIGFLEDQSMTEEKRKEEFRNVLKNNFDMKTIGRFALGRYWKTSTSAEKDEYLKLFEEMVVDVYSRRFSDYNGEGFSVLSARAQGTSDSIVSSQIIPASGSKISVEWRVREKNGTLKIIDIMVEGVSMSLTQRSDFASVIQRGGGNIDILLDHLRPQSE